MTDIIDTIAAIDCPIIMTRIRQNNDQHFAIVRLLVSSWMRVFIFMWLPHSISICCAFFISNFLVYSTSSNLLCIYFTQLNSRLNRSNFERNVISTFHIHTWIKKNNKKLEWNEKKANSEWNNRIQSNLQFAWVIFLALNDIKINFD